MPDGFGLKIKNSPGRGAKISASKVGVSLTEEHKKAISNAKKGKPIKHFIFNAGVIRAKISKAQKGIPRPYQRGANHGNWEGGITPINAAIRNSFEMKQWRIAVFKRDDYTCQVCRVRGGKLVADHVKPFCNYPDLRFDINNGRTICKECDLKSDTYAGRAKNK